MTFPITKAESEALHALGWESGYGWDQEFDWFHTPSSGPAIWVEDDADLMRKFMSDLEGIRATEVERLRKERLHAAAEDMEDALGRCETVLALIRDAKLLTDPLENSVEKVVLPLVREALAKARGEIS